MSDLTHVEIDNDITTSAPTVMATNDGKSVNRIDSSEQINPSSNYMPLPPSSLPSNTFNQSSRGSSMVTNESNSRKRRQKVLDVDDILSQSKFTYIRLSAVLAVVLYIMYTYINTCT